MPQAGLMFHNLKGPTRVELSLPHFDLGRDTLLFSDWSISKWLIADTDSKQCCQTEIPYFPSGPCH